MVFVLVHTPRPVSKGLDRPNFACLCLLASMLYACASLSSSKLFQVDALSGGCVVTSNAHEVLFRCNHLGCISKCLVTPCVPFPFSASRDAMLTTLVCATRWLSMHLYTLAYMFIHESYLLVCHPYFNKMQLWTSNPNLHLSLVDTTFCLLPSLIAFFLVCLLSCFFACHAYHAYSPYAFSYAFCIFSFHCLSAGFLYLPFHVHTWSEDA